MPLFLVIPARSTASTTSEIPSYAEPASSASPDIDTALTMMPRRYISYPSFSLFTDRFAWRSEEVEPSSHWLFHIQTIFTSFSTPLNSGSPVYTSAFLSLARAAAKQSARDIFREALNSPAISAKS